jgi:hypothetical protein
VIDGIKVELVEFSRGNGNENENHGVQFVAGDATTGEQITVSEGCASGPCTDGSCKKVGDNTIFRLASMTKIMGAAVAAIAFEEGVVQPGDSISKWIPEFDASHLTALTRHDADAVHPLEWWSIEPLERNITILDLLGMQGGFMYGFMVQSLGLGVPVNIYPDLLIAKQMTEHMKDCGDFLNALNGGTVRVFRQKFTLEDAIGSHACSLEANTRVTNGIPLGSTLLLPVCTVNCVETLKAICKRRNSL